MGALSNAVAAFRERSRSRVGGDEELPADPSALGDDRGHGARYRWAFVLLISRLSGSTSLACRGPHPADGNDEYMVCAATKNRGRGGEQPKLIDHLERARDLIEPLQGEIW